jgi:hypothetical protein
VAPIGVAAKRLLATVRPRTSVSRTVLPPEKITDRISSTPEKAMEVCA